MTLARITALGTIAIILQCLVWLRRSRALANLFADDVQTAWAEPDADWLRDCVLPLISDLAPPAGVAAQSSGCYDPRTRAIGLAPALIQQPSRATLAVIVHEIGHAAQQRDAPGLVALHPILRRVALAGLAAGAIAVGAGSVLGTGIVGAGLLGVETSLLASLALVWLERDASQRGMRQFAVPRDDPADLWRADLALVQSILDAAALTYLAAPFDGLTLLAGIFSSVEHPPAPSSVGAPVAKPG